MNNYAMADALMKIFNFKPVECKKCGGRMKPGKALAQTVTGIPDFARDGNVVTLSPGGPGKLIDCLKCTECGHSVGI